LVINKFFKEFKNKLNMTPFVHQNRKYTLILLFFAHFLALSAQSKNQGLLSNLRLIARAVNDTTIVLRWAPLNHTDWRLVSKQGFRLERAVLNDSTNAVIEKYGPLSIEPIKPWSEAECKAKVNPNTQRYAALGAQALYGKTFAAKTESEKGNYLNTIVNAAEEEENRHALALFAADISPDAGDLLGLRYVDKNVEHGFKYIYRLVAVPHPQGLYKLDTAGYVVSMRDMESLPPVRDIQAKGLDAKIQLTWRKNLNTNNLTAFFIERSEDNKNFTALNKEPYIQFQDDKKAADMGIVTFTDTLVVNYKTYYYRVRGIDAFGELSPFSAPIIAKGRDMTPPAAPFLRKIDKRTPTSYTLNWEMPKTTVNDLKGFLVLRCDKIDGKYKTLTDKMLSPTERTFTDNAASETKENYYSIIAIDTAGNVATSQKHMVFSYDAIPPAKPVGLTGSIDTNGIVTVKWRLGGETDLKGYYIFYANRADHEFTAAAPEMIIDTVFTDSIRIKVLTKHIYYKIVAVDNNLNTSPYSVILELTKPDVLPPVQPVIGRFLVSDSTVSFNWARSASTDVAKQNVYRRLSTNGEWQLLTTLNPTAERFVDRDFGRNKTYQYSIEAVDSGGLKSPKSYPLSIQTLSANLSQLVATNLTATLISDKKMATLTWEYPKTDEKIADWLIYRSAEDGTWDMVTTTQTSKFEDRTVLKRKEVKYAVKARFENGSVSNLAVSNNLKIP
jgi:uncharacterized protein